MAMDLIPRITLRRLIVWALALLALGLAGAIALAYSGLYSVAASRGHPAWLNWFLETGMERSVKMQSMGVEAPPLDAPGMVALGAGHFQGGCASCHGAPGEPVNPVYGHMLPSPPKLEDHADDWTAAQLFWIARHGIQYAGMPAWSGEGREDEVWSVVAFLRELPGLDAEDYRRLAAGNTPLTEMSAREVARSGNAASPLTACDRCHDTPDAAPVSVLVPRLAGQPGAYLERTLAEYYADKRQSGIMEPVAAELERVQMAALADWYAGLASPAHETGSPPDPALLARGEALAREGDAVRDIPACNDCHGSRAAEAYPRLAGQSGAYIESQLELWQRGGRAQTAYGQIMAPVAKRLEAADIAAVAAWYQSLPPSATVAAAGDAVSVGGGE